MPARADITVTYFHNDLTGSPVAAANEAGQVVWRKRYAPYSAASKGAEELAAWGLQSTLCVSTESVWGVDGKLPLPSPCGRLAPVSFGVIKGCYSQGNREAIKGRQGKPDLDEPDNLLQSENPGCIGWASMVLDGLTRLQVHRVAMGDQWGLA